jgi:uncharacterized protein (DUF433 family)
MIALREKIGRGIYTPSEAALYARVQTQLLNRWLHSKGGESVIEPEFGREDKELSFLDFVQALAIRSIKNTHGISLEKIREAYLRARDQYSVRYPFAMKHRTFLFGETDDTTAENKARRRKKRLELVIRLEGEKYVQLTGKEHDNLLIAEIAEVYMLDLTYEGPGGVANEYRPLTFRDRAILMNPNIHFGQPVVESCGYSVFTLFDSYKAEGGVDAAAKVYGVEREDVELALKYVDFLQRPTA